MKIDLLSLQEVSANDMSYLLEVAVQLKKAKGTFYWTVVGTAILVGAYAIASAIVNFAEKL